MFFFHARKAAWGLALFFCLYQTHAIAEEKTYTLSYSPGTLFHELVRDRAKLAYEKAGLNAEFISLPHNRSQMSANDGSVDGDVGRPPSVEEKYPNLVRVNAKLMDLNGAVYSNNPDIQEYSDDLLSSYRVGYVLGVSWAENKLKGIDATTARDYPSLFKMLKEKRIDIAFATEASADAVLGDIAGTEKIRKLKPFVFSAPIYHYVNKKNRDIIPKLQAAIEAINQAGVLVFYTGLESPLMEIVQARLQEAFRRIGKACEVRSVGSSQRALVLANEQGDGDAMRVATVKQLFPEQTDNLVMVPETILSVDLYVFTHGQKMPLPEWESLAGLRNGFRTGIKVLENKMPEQRIILPESERLFKMLASDRLDTLSEHGYIGEYIIKKLNLSDIYRSDKPLVSFPGYPFILNRHEELVPQIQASLAAMKADGRFDAIAREVLEKLLQQGEVK